MKTTTYEHDEKQPATRGGVFIGEGAKRNATVTPLRSVNVKVRLSPSERSALVARATAAGVSVSEYIRREVTTPAGVSRETELVLAAIGRLRLFTGRLRDVDEGRVDMDRDGCDRFADACSDQAAVIVANGGRVRP